MIRKWEKLTLIGNFTIEFFETMVSVKQKTTLGYVCYGNINCFIILCASFPSLMVWKLFNIKEIIRF